MPRFWRELSECVQPASAARLLHAGVSRDVMLGERWTRTSRGFYRRTTPSPPTTAQRIVDAAATLPQGAVIGGWAAAYALGVDVLDGLDDFTMQPIPVSVLLPPGLHRQAVPGLRYVQTRSAVPVTGIADIPFTKPYRTASDLACWSSSLTEAVVYLDALLAARVVSSAGLATVALKLRGRRGSTTARRAIALSRLGVRSTWESRLRMLWVLDLGLPMPLVNPPVFDLAGEFLGAPDLLDPEAGLALEYDGGRWKSTRREGGHRDVDQHREDNAREERFERAGLVVVRADKVDLTRLRPRLGQRLTAARQDGLTRDRRRDRWTTEPPPGWLGLPT